MNKVVSSDYKTGSRFSLKRLNSMGRNWCNGLIFECKLALFTVDLSSSLVVGIRIFGNYLFRHKPL
jgi:hypothetical protein